MARSWCITILPFQILQTLWVTFQATNIVRSTASSGLSQVLYWSHYRHTTNCHLTVQLSCSPKYMILMWNRHMYCLMLCTRLSLSGPDVLSLYRLSRRRKHGCLDIVKQVDVALLLKTRLHAALLGLITHAYILHTVYHIVR